MTREEARKAAEVMMSYADGKEVQYKRYDSDLWCGIVYGEPQFNWSNIKYRIKQEPTYRPFKDKEECWNEMQKHQPFGWVIGYGPYKYIISIEKTCVRTDFIKWEFDDAFRKLTFADGTPFGIKEE